MTKYLAGIAVFGALTVLQLGVPLGVSAETQCASQLATNHTATDTGPVSEGDCPNETAFAINGKNSEVGIKDVAIEFLRIAAALAGISIIAGIIFGGIVYSSAKGNPANIQKARKIIGNSLLALVLYALMFSAINFLLPGRVLF